MKMVKQRVKKPKQKQKSKSRDREKAFTGKIQMCETYSAMRTVYDARADSFPLLPREVLGTFSVSAVDRAFMFFRNPDEE